MFIQGYMHSLANGYYEPDRMDLDRRGYIYHIAGYMGLIVSIYLMAANIDAVKVEEDVALWLGMILFIPMAILYAVFPLIISCIVSSSMWRRCFHANLSGLYVIVFLPLCFLSVIWIKSWMVLPHERLVGPFPFPWYLVGFLSFLVFLALYRGSDNSVLKEPNSYTFLARLGVGISSAILTALYIPTVITNAQPFTKTTELAPGYIMKTIGYNDPPAIFPLIDYSFQPAMIPALGLIFCLATLLILDSRQAI